MDYDWRDFKARHGGSEGARAAFEKACESLFRKRHPGRNVQAVRANPGDEGIDVYVGDLGQEPIDVYQCKFFLEAIGDSQKSQIRDSFQTATSTDKYDLQKWTLCLPKVLDVAESQWWGEFRKGALNSSGAEIDLLNGDQLLKEAGNYGLIEEWFKVPLEPASLSHSEVTAYLKAAANLPIDALDPEFYLPLAVEPCDLSQGGTPSSEDGRTISLKTAISDHGNTLLLGAPGAGKTLALKHIARDLANEANTTDKTNNLVPLLCEVRHYEGQNLDEWLADRVDRLLRPLGKSLGFEASVRASRMRQWLASDSWRFVILLDGLDEIHDDYRTKWKDELSSWLVSQHTFVLTCRETDAPSFFHGTLKCYKLRPLADEHVREYLNTRLRPIQRDLYITPFKRNEHLRKLMRNPLMLQTIALVLIADPGAKLSSNRGLLFEQLMTHLPRIRREQGYTSPIPLPVLMDQLSVIGLGMHNYDMQSVEWSVARKWRVESRHEIEDVLSFAKCCRILKRDGKTEQTIEFFHPLFAKYFAAKGCEHRLRNGETLDALIGPIVFADKWYDVIEMLSGVHSNSEAFVNWLAELILKARERYWDIHETKMLDSGSLLYHCWRGLELEVAERTKEIVIDALIVSIETPNPLCDACQLLSEIDSERALADVCQMFAEQVEEVRGNLRETPHDLWPVRQLSYFGRHRYQPALKSLLRFLAIAKDDFTRNTAIKAITEILETRADDDDVCGTLTETLDDSAPVVRATSAHFLGELRASRAIPKLDQMTSCDHEESQWGVVSQIAAQAIEKINQMDADTAT